MRGPLHIPKNIMAGNDPAMTHCERDVVRTEAYFIPIFLFAAST